MRDVYKEQADLLEVVWFPRVPVLKSERLASWHPEEPAAEQIMWGCHHVKKKQGWHRWCQNKNDEDDDAFTKSSLGQQAPSGIGHWEEVSSCHLICWVCWGWGRVEEGGESHVHCLLIDIFFYENEILYWLALLSLISATGPKVLMAHTWTMYISPQFQSCKGNVFPPYDSFLYDNCIIFVMLTKALYVVLQVSLLLSWVYTGGRNF